MHVSHGTPIHEAFAQYSSRSSSSPRFPHAGLGFPAATPGDYTQGVPSGGGSGSGGGGGGGGGGAHLGPYAFPFSPALSQVNPQPQPHPHLHSHSHPHNHNHTYSPPPPSSRPSVLPSVNILSHQPPSSPPPPSPTLPPTLPPPASGPQGSHQPHRVGSAPVIPQTATSVPMPTPTAIPATPQAPQQYFYVSKSVVWVLLGLIFLGLLIALVVLQASGTSSLKRMAEVMSRDQRFAK